MDYLLNKELILSDEANSLIPAKLAFEKNILPIKKDEGILEVAIVNINDLKLLNELSFYTGLEIKAVEYPVELIISKLKEIFPDFISDNSINKELRQDNFISEFSTIELVNSIIDRAIKSGSSDIHFEVFESTFRVRFRLDGHLHEALNLQSSKGSGIISRLKIMADLDISERRRPQDGKIRYNYYERMIDIRVSSMPTIYGEKVVLRILDKSQLTLELKKLGLTESQFNVLSKNIRLSYGMILVTGPTGSGKTTTLYSALNEISSIEKNIITIEDPVEYNLEGINQSNVKPEIGYSFASALRAFLRQDPDIIMIGEIRDKETAEIAIRASLTGHLVFSTMHTNDSLSAVTRLIDMGVEPFLVASSIKLIIAQRLVRKCCSCNADRKRYNNKSNSIKNDISNKLIVHKSKTGCEICSYTGYKGRTALFEFFEINNDISDMISRCCSVKEIKNAAIINGFKTLLDSGLQKIDLGITTDEEVYNETML